MSDLISDNELEEFKKKSTEVLNSFSESIETKDQGLLVSIYSALTLVVPLINELIEKQNRTNDLLEQIRDNP